MLQVSIKNSPDDYGGWRVLGPNHRFYGNRRRLTPSTIRRLDKLMGRYHTDATINKDAAYIYIYAPQEVKP